MNRKFINIGGQFYELKDNFNLYTDKYYDGYSVDLYLDGKTITLDSCLKEEEIDEMITKYESGLIMFLNESDRSVLTFKGGNNEY